MLDWNTAQQIVRKSAGYVAAALVTYGYIDSSIQPAVIGAIVALSEIAWWAYWNVRNKEK